MLLALKKFFAKDQAVVERVTSHNVSLISLFRRNISNLQRKLMGLSSIKFRRQSQIELSQSSGQNISSQEKCPMEARTIDEKEMSGNCKQITKK